MKTKRKCPTCGRQYIDGIVVGTALLVGTVLFWVFLFVYVAYQPDVDCCMKLDDIRKIVDD